MMDFWQFWNAHPFLAWCALWLLWGVVSLAQLAVNLVNRLLRTVKVLARGWPPEGLDADGDFRTDASEDADA
jgi:hypothetical protein